MLALPSTLSAPPADPIRAAQQTFRRVLDALARPGDIQQLDPHPALMAAFPDQPRLVWPATLLLMLVDHEVSLAVTTVADGDALERVVRRRTRVAAAPVESADTVVCDGPSLTPDLITALKRGSLAYPDDGATLLILTDDRATSDAPPVTLSGPGIDGAIRTSLPGLSPDLLAARDEAIAHYPMGIDLLLLDRAGRLLGLPRTTTITTTTTATTGKES